MDLSHLLSGIGGAGVLGIIQLLVRRGFKFSVGGHDGNGNGNGKKAGEQPVDFWERKFDILDSHGQAQTKILERQTGLLEEQTKLLTELVTVSRMSKPSKSAR